MVNHLQKAEIKPKHLQNTLTNKRKKEAAMIYCDRNNLKYKMLDPIKKISFMEIKTLVDNNKIKFIDRYKEKYDLLNNNQIKPHTP